MTKESLETYENPNQLQQDLEHLKDWLLKQPHIHGRTDDEFLLRFIRGCKYSLERAKEKIDTFYTMRTAIPEFFNNRDTMDPYVQQCLQLGLLLPLGRDDRGRRVVLARVGLFDPLKIPLPMGSKSHIMVAEVLMEEEGEKIGHGHVVLLDMKGTTLTHAAHFTPAICKKTLLVYQNAFPFRPKAIHFINTAPVLETFLSLIKSILKEKLRKRIVIHKTLLSVYEDIPKKILPKEYGGSAGNVQDIIDRWRQKMIEKRSFFLEDEQYRVDENKRPGKPKSHEDLFGFEGSFRQLSLD